MVIYQYSGSLPAMVDLVRYLSHPQVIVDPDVVVKQWGLSAVGHSRVRALVQAGWLWGTTVVVSSAERKAVETAKPIAEALGINVEVRPEMHENDRSATGFLKSDEFEQVATEFFANPMKSVRGWERAIDAQSRIVREAESVIQRDIVGDILFVGHGAVGTLLYCHCAGLPIDRKHDQPAGGGNYFSVDRQATVAVHDWRPMEQVPVGIDSER